ncbi:hypothetical protein QFC19_002952 [Naganishia cerealis]|uniref:Uncharacterized protein n=1 Tax=Naganishia cerealis TaxID=610337 RepID=A0ACC2W512_9TREE|nr:hypothetical protein QFC19_002952 [Naganishia cerealis]
MKQQLPALRKKLVSDPEYFKKVYAHTFTLSLRPGARTLELEPALSYWQAFIPPALAANPSALSSTSVKSPSSSPSSSSSSTGPPEFSKADLDLWCEFMKEKGKAVSKDTWLLFIDFLRSIDKDFKEHDEEAAWPSTIDAFVEYARERKAASA